MSLTTSLTTSCNLAYNCRWAALQQISWAVAENREYIAKTLQLRKEVCASPPARVRVYLCFCVRACANALQQRKEPVALRSTVIARLSPINSTRAQPRPVAYHSPTVPTVTQRSGKVKRVSSVHRSFGSLHGGLTAQ
jgi:hypothetical protein